MTLPKVCVLVPTHNHVRNATHNTRLNVGKYFGLKIVLNELEKHFDLKPDFVTHESVHLYDIVLVSIHSVNDYYGHAHTFYYHLKGQRRGIWIAGGSAIQNLPPLLDIFDFIFIGRAEGLLIPFFTALLANKPFTSESIVSTFEYSQWNRYKINYVQKLYPEQLGKEKETMLGCKYNCAYCRYRISALPPTKRDVDNRTTMPGNEETFFDLHINSGKQYTTSLDGLTESIRFAVFKRISNDTIIQKFKDFSLSNPSIRLKVYLIIGYPGKSEVDFSELRYVFNQIDKFLSNHRYVVQFHVTPFSAEPGTPMQWEPVNIFDNYSQIISAYKKTHGDVYHSPRLSAYIMTTTMSNYSVLLRSIHHRAHLHQVDVIRYISESKFQRSHSNMHTAKFDDLVKRFDLDPFIKAYPIGARLSSSNIHSWRSQSDIESQAHQVRKSLALA